LFQDRRPQLLATPHEAARCSSPRVLPSLLAPSRAPQIIVVLDHRQEPLNVSAAEVDQALGMIEASLPARAR
jgi:hypothetical protein